MQQKEIFVILGYFLPFYPTNKPKNQNFEKMDILSFYICLPRMTFIWCMVPEIWSSTGKIFSHFGPFFVLLLKNQNFEKKAWRYNQLSLVYHKWQSYDVWFLRYKVQRTELFLDYFLPFSPLPVKTCKIKTLIKWKKKKKFLEILSVVP